MSDVTFGGKYETKDISIGRFKLTLKGVQKFVKYIVKKLYGRWWRLMGRTVNRRMENRGSTVYEEEKYPSEPMNSF